MNSPDDLSPEQPFTTEHAAELRNLLAADRRVTERRVDFLDDSGERNGEVVTVRPEIIRLDETTGEPVIPLLLVQGMGGDDRLPVDIQALAEADQRPVIGVRYDGPLQGSAESVAMEGVNEPVPRIDVDQAEDLIRMLQEQGMDQVDAAGLSRGCVRLVAAMKQHPELFRNAYLLHPAGQDDRTYRQAHLDAAREQMARALRQAPEGAEPGKWSRLEQKSVARARLSATLGELDPRIHVTVAGDARDKAFHPERLRQTSQKAGVDFEQTDLGGHVRLGDARVPGLIVRGLRRMEQALRS